jgi:hypothetical protein
MLRSVVAVSLIVLWTHAAAPEDTLRWLNQFTEPKFSVDNLEAMLQSVQEQTGQVTGWPARTAELAGGLPFSGFVPRQFSRWKNALVGDLQDPDDLPQASWPGSSTAHDPRYRVADVRTTTDRASLRVGIVGAGPAGITLALRMLEEGFTNITMFGRGDRSQARTIVVDGVWADVGKCFSSTSYYNTERVLEDKHGFTRVFLPPYQVQERDGSLAPVVEVDPSLVDEWSRFSLLSVQAMREQDNPRHLDKYAATAAEFLEDHDLGTVANASWFLAANAAQGYGQAEDTSAFAALRWWRPTLFVTGVATLARRGLAVVEGGFGAMYDHLRRKVPVVVPHHVTRVRPRGGDARGGHVWVGDERHEFDLLVMAANVPRKISRDLPAADELHPRHQRHTDFVSIVWTSANPGPWEDMAFLVHELRTRALDRMVTVRPNGKTRGGRYVFTAVAYASAASMASVGGTAHLHEQLLRHADELGVPAEEVHHLEVFRYNVRWTADALRSGQHLSLRDKQGLGGVYYTGGALRHWDVDNIMEHNEHVLEQIIWDLGPQRTRDRVTRQARELQFWFEEM